MSGSVWVTMAMLAVPADQTCYQSDQSDERLQIDLSEAIVRSILFDLFAKTRVVKSDLIDLDKIELSEFKLT
jgi:hypothetical protein